MTRAWHTWLIFSLCLATGLAAMGWTSLTVIRLHKAESKARHLAAQAEDIRVALWRMESALAPLIAQEGARPYYSYAAFYSPAQAYSRMFAPIQTKELLLPSPLLTFHSPLILLHFQVDAESALTSPQAPKGNMRDLAEAGYTNPPRIQEAERLLADLSRAVSPRDLWLASGPVPENPSAASSPALTQQRQNSPLNAQRAGRSKAGYAEQILQQEAGKRTGQNQVNLSNAADLQQQQVRAVTEEADGLMKPVWMNGCLLLVRSVTVDKHRYAQGCWLNWQAIRQTLLTEINDLLPRADVQPATSAATQTSVLRLAGLPVQLVPGSLTDEALDGSSPILMLMLLAWGGIAAAAVAVAALLRGALSLSERRATFVSAVTHELRTPLTTFRLYSDLLAQGRITDPDKQHRYFDRLRSEADRLGHLVDNVLAYARLEHRRVSRQLETLRLGDILGRMRDRLQERAARSEMTLCIETEPAADAASICTDASMVEQILLNLVDNACKYAAEAQDRRIHLEAEVGRGGVLLRVRDHGPGIAADAVRRLFRPFSKSAHQAAHSAPGVGLGLALSARLARDLGGQLRFEPIAGDGACFSLLLPVAHLLEVST